MEKLIPLASKLIQHDLEFPAGSVAVNVTLTGVLTVTLTGDL